MKRFDKTDIMEVLIYLVPAIFIISMLVISVVM